MKKNETLTLTITDLSYQGLGVAKAADKVIFVADALVGEQVVAKILKVQKNIAFAKAIEHLTTSPDRVAIKNARYTQTGIAPLQHLSYRGQLAFKRHQIEQVLHKQHLDEIEVGQPAGMATPYAYRNKAAVPVRLVDGQVRVGFFRRNSHDFVPLTDFLIQDPRIDAVLKVVVQLLNRYHIAAFDEAAHKGCVRTVVVRRGYYSKEVMVGLVTRTKNLPHAAEFARSLQQECPDVVSVLHNVNPAKTNVILGPTTHTLAGKSTITDTLNGLQFEISLHSFYQVNPTQTEVLYQKAVAAAGLDGSQTVIDAYCGIGTISLNLAKAAKQVLGVEVVPQAIADAKHNAQLNHITNAKFVVGTTEEWMAKWQAAGVAADVVVFDPPRKGLAASVIAATAQMKVSKVVYVSCNPATLARDLALFKQAGYAVTQPIQPVDQFPQTPHIESVTVLERTQAD